MLPGSRKIQTLVRLYPTYETTIRIVIYKICNNGDTLQHSEFTGRPVKFELLHAQTAAPVDGSTKAYGLGQYATMPTLHMQGLKDVPVKARKDISSDLPSNDLFECCLPYNQRSSHCSRVGRKMPNEFRVLFVTLNTWSETRAENYPSNHV